MLGRAKRTSVQEGQPHAVVPVLQCLWQSKLWSVRFIDLWANQTADAEIEAGLRAQLVDERLHMRLAGDQIRRLGGNLERRNQSDGLKHVFTEIELAQTDLLRLFAYFRGVKAFNAERASHLMPLVDRELASALDRIFLDEERQLRWADMRIARFFNLQTMREANFFLERTRKGLESSWSRPWRDFTYAIGHRRTA